MSQLDFIRVLQEFRTPALDAFFKFWQFFDRQEFAFVLIPMTWIGYHWKAGMKLFYLMTLSGLVNLGLKTYFQVPRPCVVDSSVGLSIVDGHSFPSGAAQTAMIITCIIVGSWKGRLRWAIALNFLFWVSLSRVYLGAHYPSDILAGWVTGFLLWLLFSILGTILEKKISLLSLESKIGLSLCAPTLLWATSSSQHILQLTYAMFGVSFGLYLALRFKMFFPPPVNFKEFIQRSLVGIIGAFTVYQVTQTLSFHWQFFLLGVWLSVGGNYVWRSLKR